MCFWVQTCHFTLPRLLDLCKFQGKDRSALTFKMSCNIFCTFIFLEVLDQNWTTVFDSPYASKIVLSIVLCCVPKKAFWKELFSVLVFWAQENMNGKLLRKSNIFCTFLGSRRILHKISSKIVSMVVEFWAQNVRDTHLMLLKEHLETRPGDLVMGRSPRYYTVA